MRGLANFVKVIRLVDGCEMRIVDHVAEKYPEKFQIIKEEEEKKVVKKRAPRKKVGGKGVSRKVESKEE